MGSRTIWTVVIALCLGTIAAAIAWYALLRAVFPSQPTFDEAGGYVLVYEVDVPAARNGDEVISDVIEVLQQRVDPQGVLQIQFRHLTEDQIEVRVPVPPEIRSLRSQYLDAREAVVSRMGDAGDELVAALEGDTAGRLESLKSRFNHLSGEIDDLIDKRDAYQAQRSAGNDPDDIVRLLRGAGVLEFRIAVMAGKAEGINVQELRDQLEEVGAANVDSTVARWFEINDLEQWYDHDDQLADLENDPEDFFARYRGLVGDYHDGKYYLLMYTTPRKSLTHEGDTDWKIDRAWLDSDRMGRACVAFRLDPVGGQLMGRLTGPHVQQPMAIILDGQVFGAPTLQTQILNRGQITGNFSQAELLYLIRVLEAGDLPAPLSSEPVSVEEVEAGQ
ncbi:MAG: hypothetical protein JSV91_07560 [Phycisphaerales bacterium]|nr:MAG: hypothetical protein JSV91_07560 [Phycisphaerales bacterium]